MNDRCDYPRYEIQLIGAVPAGVAAQPNVALDRLDRSHAHSSNRQVYMRPYPDPFCRLSCEAPFDRTLTEVLYLRDLYQHIPTGL